MASDQDPAKPRALIFQSYGWKDASEVAERLTRDLRAAGYEVWIDRERIREQLQPQDMFPEAIRKAIREADIVLVLVSPHSVRLPGDADNQDNGASVCLNELVLAHEDRKPIVPVIVMPCEPPFLINIVKRIDLSGRSGDEEGFREGVKEILATIEMVQQRGSSIYIPQLERLHPLDFRNEVIRGAHSFAGRNWLFDRFASWLDGKRSCLMIEGDAGSGKSAIVAELVRRDPGGHMLAYHFCRADQATTIQPAEFVRSLAAMIGGRIDAYGTQLNGDELRIRLVGDACVADPLTAFIGCIVNPLASLPDLGLRYLVVDGLDEALAPQAGQSSLSIPLLLARALPDFPPWLKLVVTTRRDARLNMLFQDAEHVGLSDDDPLQRKDVAGFLAKHFDTGAITAGAARAAIAAAIEARSAGNFLYAQQVVESFERGEIGLDEIDKLPKGLGALFARKFLLHFPDAASYVAAERLLGVTLAAKQPLTEKQIASASGLRLREEVRPILEKLTGYIVAASLQDGVEAHTVFHKSLADWLTAPGPNPFRVDVGEGRDRLLAWCRDWRSSQDPYVLNHVISHLLDAGEVDEALAAVRGGLFGKRKARMVRADLEDTMALALALIGRDDEPPVVELATTGSPWQRDGAAAALIAAPSSADPLVERIVSRLLHIKIVDHLNPSPEAMAARRTAIRVCEARGFDERLLRMAKDKTPAVRVVLAAMIYRHWVRQRERGWRLIDGLAGELLGFLSLPNGAVLEVLGHASLAMLNNHREEKEEMSRLRSVWRSVARRAMRGPVVRAVGRQWTLNLMLGPLTELMKRQPAYQPLNTREMSVTFARDDRFRRNWRLALDCLEHPQAGITALVDMLTGAELPFDVYLMLVAERALICRGMLDLDGTFDTIELLFREGQPWFQQSALYALFHILQNVPWIDDDKLRRYGAMTEDFFTSTGATMTTSVATYSFSPHLAWPEIIVETQRRGDAPWLLPRLLERAIASRDEDRIERVFKAIDLIGFAYARVTLALSLIEKANGIGGAAVEARIVESLANIRFQDEALVDEFLERPDFVRLRPLVKAASPTIRGEDIPTWVDGFVVQSLLTSQDFHRDVCAAFRRALEARSTAECLRQILIWVVGLLAGEPAYAPT
jgi:TIR domain/NACHT domain